MPQFTLNNISQYRHPRWPILSGDESLALLGYAYGRSVIATPSHSAGTVDRRFDLVMAVFCCGGHAEQIREAIFDYVTAVRHYLSQDHACSRDVRKAIVYSQDALLLSFACNHHHADLESIASIASDLIEGFDVAIPADSELSVTLQVLLACVGKGILPSSTSIEHPVSLWLQGVIENDVERVHDGIRERFITSSRFYTLDGAISESPHLLEKASNYWRFGCGLVHLGLLRVAGTLGIPVADLKTAIELKPYIGVFAPD